MRAGIIPARAGFTAEDVRARKARKDHPRSRGVYAGGWSAAAAVAGSSPLARGLHHIRRRDRPSRRIIPARAGFTAGGSGVHYAEWDHPRSRGVYPSVSQGNQPTIGSSPLARGLPRKEHHHALRHADHPRSRGVYVCFFKTMRIVVGSSPLARGLPPLASRPSCLRGIIPARAGFTRSSITPGPSVMDHPRSRGVYVTLTARIKKDHRIIPARAGFTWWIGDDVI